MTTHELRLLPISLCIGDGQELVRREKMVVGMAEPLYGHGVEDIVRNAKENTQPQECRQGEERTCLSGFYNRHAFRGNREFHCAELREINLTAREMLAHRALDHKLH